jgi:NADPH:quinone reductase-like Zn-dependent oxidoreductase
MRAWELQAFGLDNLVLVDRPEPQPGPGQVAVRVKAAALNSRDLQVMADRYLPDQRLPIVPLCDGVGEVVALGEGVTRLAVGDRVLPAFAQRWVAGERTPERWLSHGGGHLDGMLQEVALLEADGAALVPEHLSDVQAAAAGAAWATAWQALFVQGGLRAGETVLVLGTGGVSIAALQLAVAAGAQVIVTSGSDEKIEQAKGLGALGGVNYRSRPDWDAAVLELTGGEGVDHVVENAGDLERSAGCLRMGGLISLIGYLSQLDLSKPPVPYRYELSVRSALQRNIRIQGITVGPRESYDSMLRAIAANRIEPAVDSRVFAFEEAPDAFRHLASGTHFGKVCVSVAD